MKYIITLTLSLFLMNSFAETSNKQKQSEKAQKMADSIQFSGNAEIENIKTRLELTSNPLLMGYIVLFNKMGQPIMYTTVKGKVTSGSKRLTSKQNTIWCDGGGHSKGCNLDAPSDEGAYGSSGAYVYFWTMNGQYIQWGKGDYYYSTNPIRLNVKPLIVNINIKKLNKGSK